MSSTRPPTQTRSLFYGWYVVMAGGAIFGVVVGLTFFSLGTLFAALEAEFGWTRGEISTGLSLSFLAGGGLAYTAGRIVDRFGPRLTLSAGAVILGSGLMLLSQVGAYWQFVVLLLVMAVGRIMTTQPAVNVVIANWFVRKRSLAFGMSRIGLSLLSFVAVPITAALISAFGWRQAVLINGFAVIAIVVPLVLLIIRRRPEDLGLLPDGDSNPVVSGVLPESVTIRSVPSGDSLRTVIRDRAFWSIAVAGLCFFFAEVPINLHFVPFLTGRGVPFQEAATIGGAIPATYVIGSLLMGAIAVRFPARLVMAGAYVIAGASIALIWILGGSPLIWLAIPLFGVGAGSINALQSALVADLFGLRNYGAILGALTGILTIGVILGPLLTGVLYDQAGGYGVPFFLFGTFQLIGAGIILFARRPEVES